MLVSCRSKWGAMDIPAGQRMIVAHRGSAGLDPVYLVPQLCLLYPLPQDTCHTAQCAPPPLNLLTVEGPHVLS